MADCARAQSTAARKNLRQSFQYFTQWSTACQFRADHSSSLRLYDSRRLFHVAQAPAPVHFVYPHIYAPACFVPTHFLLYISSTCIWRPRFESTVKQCTCPTVWHLTFALSAKERICQPFLPDRGRRSVPGKNPGLIRQFHQFFQALHQCFLVPAG